ncbi:hypothetical protein LSAT2_015302 [Lamellibrachia satsuma]|nr:hypothetical protein LSAT2_015302 [Lamellibrachia satsuma]
MTQRSHWDWQADLVIWVTIAASFSKPAAVCSLWAVVVSFRLRRRDARLPKLYDQISHNGGHRKRSNFSTGQHTGENLVV